MSHLIDKSYFPGWTRKSVTFTIDDGDVTNDEKFLAIVRPAGILGTFNLCDVSKLSPEEYRELYRGYEIANHVKLHPHIFVPGKEYPLCDELFDFVTADTARIYRHPEEEGVYFSHGSFFSPKTFADRNKWWFRITDHNTYVKLIDKAHKELEEVFGKGSVRSFVWPFGKQIDNAKVLAHVEKIGYYGARDAGSPIDSFDLPSDRMDWKYCATDGDLMTKMEKYEALPDDGKLKFFSFGVHSIDYERAGRWGRLAEFAEKYGNRREDYYYASVGDIFDYEDAIKTLIITDTEIVNPSDKPIYLKLDGECVIIAPDFTLKLA